MSMRLVGGTLLLLSVCVLGMAGCGTEPAAGPAGASSGARVMDVEQIDTANLGPTHLDKHRALGEPIHVQNLTVWPVHTDKPIDIGEFLTLPEAEQRKVAVVRELGGAGGQGQQRQVIELSNDDALPSNENPTNDNPTSHNPAGNDRAEPGVQEEGEIRVVDGELVEAGAEVGRVVIENKGDLPILVVAGTIIDGGNQDRQIGQDFVIAAHTTVDVDAFCVEHGRWGTEAQEIAGIQGGIGGGADGVDVREFSSFRSPINFNSLKAGTIAPKVVRMAGQYEQDQGKVWQEVKSSNGKLKTENPTDTLMGAIHEADEKTKAARAAYEQAITAAFAKLAEGEHAPIGFAYAINGKPVTVRAFAHERLLRSQLPLFVKAMALEAQMVSAEEGHDAKATAADVIAMVRGIQAQRRGETIATKAANENVYFKNDTGYNARCEVAPSKLQGYRIPATGQAKIVITEDWTAR